MSEQSGNDPNKRLPLTGTLHLVRGGAEDAADSAPTQADPNQAAGNQPSVENTLPINSAELAQSAVNANDAANGIGKNPQVGQQQQPSGMGSRFRHLQSWREGGLGKVYIALDQELHR